MLDRRNRPVRSLPAILYDLQPDAWEDLPLARRRAVLAETVREVWVYGADIPVDRRVHIVWVGEEPPDTEGHATDG